MRPYVFKAKPKFCVAFKPGFIWVRCAKCGKPHREYLGPDDRDERAAEAAFLRQEYDKLVAILLNQPMRAIRRAPG